MSRRLIIIRVVIIIVSAVIVLNIFRDREQPETPPVIPTVTAIPQFVSLPAPQHELLDNGQFSVQVDGYIRNTGWLTDDTFVVVAGKSEVPFIGHAQSFFWDTSTMTYKFGFEGETPIANADTGQLFLMANRPDSSEKEAQIRDLMTGAILFSLGFDGQSILGDTTFHWINDNQQLMGIDPSEGTLQIWDAQTGQLLNKIDFDPLPRYRFFPRVYDTYAAVYGERISPNQDEENALLYIIDTTGINDVIFRLQTRPLQWHHILNDLLYIIDETDTFTVYDLLTSEAVYTNDIPGIELVFNQRPLLPPDQILYFTTEGLLNAWVLLNGENGEYTKPLFKMPIDTNKDQPSAVMALLGVNSYTVVIEDSVVSYTFFDLDPASGTFGELLGGLTYDFPEPTPFAVINLADRQLAVAFNEESGLLEFIDYMNGDHVFTLENAKQVAVSPDHAYAAIGILPAESNLECDESGTTVTVIDFGTFEPVLTQTESICTAILSWSPRSDHLALLNDTRSVTIVPVTSFTE